MNKNPKAFIGGLDFKITQERLEKEVKKYVEPIEVILARDRRDGRSRGFGFAELANKADFDMLHAKMNDTNVEGRRVFVKLSEERGARVPRRDE